MVPKNIHTTTEGIGNSRELGGSKAQEIPEGWGGGADDQINFNMVQFNSGLTGTDLAVRKLSLTDFGGTF